VTRILKTFAKNARFEALTAVMFQIEVFWVVTPCSDVVGYRHFGG